MNSSILLSVLEADRFTHSASLIAWAVTLLSKHYQITAGFLIVFQQEKRAEIIAAAGSAEKSFLSGLSIPLPENYTLTNSQTSIQECLKNIFHISFRTFNIQKHDAIHKELLVVEDTNFDEQEINLFILYLEKIIQHLDFRERISLPDISYQLFDKLRATINEPENYLSQTLPLIGELLQAEGISLKLGSLLWNWGKVPSHEQIETLRDIIEGTSSLPFIWHTHCVSQVASAWHSCKRFASGVLWIIFEGGELMAFRPEKTKVIRWASHPYQPKSIPAIWTQTISGESAIWTSSHIENAQKIVELLQISHRLQKQNQEYIQNRLSRFLKFTHEWVITLSDDDEIIFANQSFYQAIGASAQENIHLLAYLYIDDILTFLEDISAVRKGIRPLSHLEFRIISQQGEIHYLSGIATRLHIGNLTNILINARDISSDVRRNQNLIRFKTAINTSTNAIIVLNQSPNKEWVVAYINNAYAKLIGKKTNQIIGKPFDLFAEQEVWEIKNFQKHIEEEKNYNTFLRYQNNQGRVFWLQCQFSFMHIKDSSPSCIVIMNDVTEFRQTEEKMRDYSEKLRISNEELQTFAYVASHDLQEPLRTISGFSELIVEKLKDDADEETKEYLQFMVEATARMKNLIRDLLKFSRLTTQNEYLTEVNMTVPLENAIKNLHSSIEATQAVITYQSMPTLLANETLMLQLFQNLLSNAIKYRKKDTPPNISINVKEEENHWIFSVKDNGIGIEERFFDRIFVIFQRLHTKEQYSGTGIGLAICRKIVEKHGGRIWLTSKIGEGSTFYFSLPKTYD